MDPGVGIGVGAAGQEKGFEPSDLDPELWWDADRSVGTSGTSTAVTNLGSGAFDGRGGTSTFLNSNAPQFLSTAHSTGTPVGPHVYVPGGAGNYMAVPHNSSLSILGQPGTGYLSLPGVTGNYALTPDNAALDITGDIELIMRLRMEDWTPAGSNKYPFGKRVTTGNQRSWLVEVLTDGRLRLYWSADGTTELSAISTVAPTFADGTTYWVRITLDVDDGAGNRVVTFSFANDSATVPTSWTPIGSTVTTAGTTSIFNSTAPVVVGGWADGGTDFVGNCYRAIIRNGIGGTTVFDADFTSQPLGTRSFTEATGKLVSLVGAAANIVDGTTYGYLSGVSGTYFSAPDAAALDITGDIDIKVQVALDDWTPAAQAGLAMKIDTTSNQRSYGLNVETNGELVLRWSTDGITTLTAGSGVATGIADGSVKWVRGTLDVNNGAGSRVVKFYTSDDGTTWTQLGSTITTAGTTSIFNGTSALNIGSINNGGAFLAAGKVYRVIIQSAYDTTNNTTSKVFDADFTRQLQFNPNIAVAGQTFTEAHGAVVTANGSARVERERDLEIVARVALEQWSGSGADQTIVSKWGADGARAYELVAQTAGTLALRWTPTGNNAQTVTIASAAHSIPNEAFLWVKATLDIQSNGYQVRFYTAPDADVPVWTELTPAPAAGVGATSVFPVTAPVEVAGSEGGTVRILTGRVREAVINNGVGGSTVFDVDFGTELLSGSEVALRDDASTVIPAADQMLPNLGWGGTAGNARFGSAALPDSNDPALLDHTGTNYLYLPGSGGNGLLAQDANALDVTGDLDLRCWVTLDDWTPAAISTFIAKYGGSPNNSFLFTVNTTGNLVLNWSANGTAVSTATSTVPTGLADGTSKWVRVTLDVDNGALGNTATFFLSDDGITWTQLGAPVTAAGTTSIFNSTSSVQVGVYGTSSSPIAGRFHRVQILNGIGGTVVYDADLSQVNTGAALAAPLTGSVATDLNASYVSNLGTLGLAAPGRPGSGTGVDTNDPLWLSHTGTNYLYLPGVANNNASTPDSAALSITGDIDIKVWMVANWQVANVNVPILGKGIFNPNKSYELFIENYLTPTGRITLRTSSDGTAMTTYMSSAGVPFASGSAGWIRATLDVDNGAAGKTAKFYTSLDGVSWTQLGSTVTTSGTTSIYNSSEGLLIGTQENGYAAQSMYRVIIQSAYDTPDNTTALAFDANFSTGITSGGQTSFTESSANAATVTINRSTSGRKSVAVVKPVWLFGTDDFMEFPNQPDYDFGASDSFSVVAAFRQWGTPSATQTVLAKGSAFTSAAGYTVGISTGRAAFGRISDGTNNVLATGATLSDGAVRFVSSVRSVATDNLTMFTDGVAGASGSDTTALTLSNSEVLRFGRLSGANTNYADMEFFGAAVFRRALSAAEITTLNDYYVNGGSVAAAEALLATAVLWVDASKSRAQAAIVRATSGRKAVAVTRPTLLFGTDDYLEIADDPAGLFDFEATDSFTIMAMVRTFGSPTDRGILAKTTSATATMLGYVLYTNAVGIGQHNPRFGDGTNRQNPAVINLIEGQLTTRAITRNVATDQVQSFVNQTASAVLTDTTTGTIANAEALRIGRFSGTTTGYADMEFFGAAIFRRALTQSEISLISDYYQTGANQVAAETLLSTAVLWLDPRYQAVAQINRASNGRKSVAVTRAEWLAGTDDYLTTVSNGPIYGDSDSFTLLLVVRRWFDTAGGNLLEVGDPAVTASRLLLASSGQTITASAGGVTNAGVIETGVGSLELIGVIVDRNTDTIQLVDNDVYTAPVSVASVSTLGDGVFRIAGRAAAYDDLEVLAVMAYRRVLTPAEIAQIKTYYLEA